jgi:hypothetical protein
MLSARSGHAAAAAALRGSCAWQHQPLCSAHSYINAQGSCSSSTTTKQQRMEAAAVSSAQLHQCAAACGASNNSSRRHEGAARGGSSVMLTVAPIAVTAGSTSTSRQQRKEELDVPALRVQAHYMQRQHREAVVHGSASRSIYTCNSTSTFKA